VGSGGDRDGTQSLWMRQEQTRSRKKDAKGETGRSVSKSGIAGKQEGVGKETLTDLEKERNYPWRYGGIKVGKDGKIPWRTSERGWEKDLKTVTDRGRDQAKTVRR